MKSYAQKTSRKKQLAQPRPPDATDPRTQLKLLSSSNANPSAKRKPLPPAHPLHPAPPKRTPELLSVNGSAYKWNDANEFLGSCQSVQNFEKLNQIGEGTFGVVYRARCRRSDKVVALKRIRMENEDDGLPISSLREIMLLSELEHPNIVAILDVVVGRSLESIFMVMEYCEHDMATLLDNMKTPFSASDTKCLMQQLLNGLGYCHDRFIIHRDMKLSNLLLTSEGILKIADFGLARQYGYPTRPMTPTVVTLWYRAPELLFGDANYSVAVDLWSVGCIFGELLRHAPLLPGNVEQKQVELIVRLLGKPTERIWSGFNNLPLAGAFALPDQNYSNIRSEFPNATDATRELVNAFLTYDPRRRITVKEALNHEYFWESPPAKDPQFLPTHPDPRMMSSSGRAKRQMQRRAEEAMDHDLKRKRELVDADFDINSRFPSEL